MLIRSACWHGSGAGPTSSSETPGSGSAIRTEKRVACTSESMTINRATEGANLNVMYWFGGSEVPVNPAPRMPRSELEPKEPLIAIRCGDEGTHPGHGPVQSMDFRRMVGLCPVAMSNPIGRRSYFRPGTRPNEVRARLDASHSNADPIRLVPERSRARINHLRGTILGRWICAGH